MKRCLDLAVKGLGNVAPNPMVGCVIVYKDKIIGQGYHKVFGGAHAEVNAINSVKDKSLLKDSILYVSLEPCSHFGKTPPCSDLIIRYKIKYVVIGSVDPNPIVTGKGIHKLASSSCDVKVGVLEKECKALNKRFYVWHEKNRPYVILKWAQTSDRYIGVEGKRIKISGSAADKLVHRWRSQEQAVLTGTKTVLTDNPRLTVRKVKGKNPMRVFIDRLLKVPANYHLLDRSVPTLVFTSKPKKGSKNLEYIKTDFNKTVVQQILKELKTRNIQSLIVEGGAKLTNAFISENLWDEARTITGNKKLGQLAGNRAGVDSPLIAGEVIESKKAGSDSILILRNTF